MGASSVLQYGDMRILIDTQREGDAGKVDLERTSGPDIAQTLSLVRTVELGPAFRGLATERILAALRRDPLYCSYQDDDILLAEQILVRAAG